MQNRNCIEISLNKNKNNDRKVILANCSSSEDDESNGDNYKSKVNKDLIQIQHDTSKAIEKEINNNNPFIYDYDEAYDEIHKEKENGIKSKHQSKEAKYMKAIIQSSHRNKIETIMMKEKVLRDRLKRENGEDDVPVFITKKYKEALDDLNKRNLPESHEEVNTINNKEFGMMGFYSHLLTKNKLYSNSNDDNKADKLIEKDNNNKDIAAIYNKRKKEYERNLPQVAAEVIKKNITKPIEITSENMNDYNTPLDKKEEYLSRYLQRKKNRENKDA